MNKFFGICVAEGIKKKLLYFEVTALYWPDPEVLHASRWLNSPVGGGGGLWHDGSAAKKKNRKWNSNQWGGDASPAFRFISPTFVLSSPFPCFKRWVTNLHNMTSSPTSSLSSDNIWVSLLGLDISFTFRPAFQRWLNLLTPTFVFKKKED